MTNEIQQSGSDLPESYDSHEAKRLTRKWLARQADRDLLINWWVHRASGGFLRDFEREHDVAWPDIDNLMTGHPQLWEFAQRVEMVHQRARNMFREDEADRRALAGEESDKYSSDKLLEMQLKANRPDKYTDRKEVKHTGLMVTLNLDTSLPDSPETIVQEDVTGEEGEQESS